MRPFLRLPSLTARDRRALRVGAWILAPVLLGTVVIRPWVTTVLASSAALVRERGLLARELRLVADSAADRRRLAAARALLEASAPQLFGGAEEVTASAELVRYVGTYAAESGLTLDHSETETVLDVDGKGRSAPGRTTDDSRPDTSAGRLRVTIGAHGDVDAIVDFLHGVERGPKLVRVEALAIGRAAEGTAPNDTELSFTATISGLARNRLVGPARGIPIEPTADVAALAGARP